LAGGVRMQDFAATLTVDLDQFEFGRELPE
jgi:hypothetical protein